MKTSERSVCFYIGKMTCVNCQNKIERALRHTEGVLSASVSYVNGTADVLYDEKKISRENIIAVIEKSGYDVLSGKGQQRTDIRKMIGLLAVIVFLYVILQYFGILNLLVPSQLADKKMGYGMLFVVGIVTSVHCIAMCGGINLSQCLWKLGQREGKQSKMSVYLPALSYNFGRVVSYTMIGFVLGLVGFLIGGGTEFGLSNILQGVLKIIAGLFMVIMGINMLNLFPGLRRFTIRTPGFIVRKTGKARSKINSPFLVGICNGFMPCGPLQSMWIVALASANPLTGALSMLLFSLGTVPLMMGLGSIVSALGEKFTDKVMTVGAVLVTTLGVAMLSQGGALSGWFSPELLLVLLIVCFITGVLLCISSKKRVWKTVIQAVSLAAIIYCCAVWSDVGSQKQKDGASSAEEGIAEGEQIINSALSPGQYPDITAQAGIPVRWIIDAPEGSINGCNYKMIIPDYDMEYTFHEGENVIEFTPTEVGTVQYSCWMGMIHGSISVTEAEQG